MVNCLSCKKLTKNLNVKANMTKNKRPYITANCDICKRLKSKFALLIKLKETDF